MEATYSIAIGVGAKTGEGEYILGFDYDNVSLLDAEKEIKSLQKTFDLSDCLLYKTKKGFSPVFIYDNELSHDEIKKIHAASTLCDTDYKKNFVENPNNATLMRVAGKYERDDIALLKNIPGSRKPSFIEKNTAQNLENEIASEIENAFMDCNRVKVTVDTQTDEIKKVEIVGNKKEEKLGFSSQEIEDIFSDTPSEEKKVPAAVSKKEEKYETGDKVKMEANKIWPHNATISKIRNDYYMGELRPIVARLISSHCNNRKIGVYKDEKNFGKLVKYKEIEIGKKVSINSYGNKEPIFLSNSPILNKDKVPELMLKRYDFNLEHTGLLKNPLNFFRGLATLDMGNIVLDEKIRNSKLHKWQTMSDLHKYVQDNIYDLITGYDLPFDFDSENLNGTEAYDQVKKLKEYFDSKKIPYSLQFSGAKGFHILIPTHLINSAVPGYLPFLKKGGHSKMLKNVTSFLTDKGIKFDKGIWNRGVTGYDRPAYSIHQNTGCIVLPLTDSRFNRLEGFNLREVQEIFRADNLMRGAARVFDREYIQKRKEEGLEVSQRVRNIVSEIEQIEMEFVQRKEGVKIDEEFELLKKEHDKKIRKITDSIPSEKPNPFKGKNQRKDIVLKMIIDGKYMSWEEMRDSRKYEGEWEAFRGDYVNPTNKELRSIAKEDPKKFAAIVKSGFYKMGDMELKVETPEYVDLNTGENCDLCRSGDLEALREFIEDIMK